MNKHLKNLPETINCVFNVLDLLVLRVALLALVCFGAYALVLGHGR